MVCIKAREREHIFDILDLIQNASFSFTPENSLFCPACGNINEVHGVGKHAPQRIAAMSDRVGFKITRPGFISLIHVDGDLFAKECSRLSRGLPSFLILNTDGLENPVDGGWGYAQESLCHLLDPFPKMLVVFGKMALSLLEQGRLAKSRNCFSGRIIAS